VIDKKI